jgi:hypothetical protein
VKIRSAVKRQTLSLTLFMAWVCAVFVLASTSRAHPHDEPEIYEVKGTLTKVDLVNQIIEVDTIDTRTKTPRNLLLFVDRKVKIRNGKTHVKFAELHRGQRVLCTVERKHQEGREDRERLTVFEIRLDVRS